MGSFRPHLVPLPGPLLHSVLDKISSFKSLLRCALHYLAFSVPPTVGESRSPHAPVLTRAYLCSIPTSLHVNFPHACICSRPLPPTMGRSSRLGTMLYLCLACFS